MIYADFATIPNINVATFDHRDENAGLPNWVTALEMNNSSLGHTAEITINDNFLNGVVANSCDNLVFLNIKFGTFYVKQITPYIPNQPYSQNAFIFNNCSNINLGHVTIDQPELGVQFYNNENTNPQTSGSAFHHLTIQNASVAGLILAPDANPITNTNPTLNTDMTPMKVDILCSRISGCEYGIIGSGKKTDFEGYTTVGSTKIYNQTDPSIDFSGTNVVANILWSEAPSWNSSNQMKYYSANSWPYINQIVSGLTGAIDLDGTATTNNNYKPAYPSPFNSLGATSATGGVFCQPNWLSFKKTPTTVINSEEALKFAIYPNPAHNLLNVEMSREDNLHYSYKIINQLGQVVLKQQGFTTSKAIDITELPIGIYHIQLIGTNTLFTAKFIKQ